MHPEVLKAVAVTAELTGTQLSETAARVFAADLAEYPVDQVLAALTRCRREVKGRLTVAEVVARIVDSDGRPGVEQAWAMLPKDEASSGVVTQEMLTAYGAAEPLLKAGDMIGARMAFKEVYQRELTAARAAGKPVRWAFTGGHDPARRESVIHQAVIDGRLSRTQALQYLPTLDDSAPDPAGRARISAIRATLLPHITRQESADVG